MARSQTAGRGQRGRSWTSEPGANLLFTSLLDPVRVSAHPGHIIGNMAALAITDLLALLANDKMSYHVACRLSIKWPNDIYVGDKKLAGILVENIHRGNAWKWSVLGIGINLNQQVFDANLPNPVSLSMITGKTYDPIETGKQLCGCLDNRFRQLLDNGPAAQLDELNKMLYRKWETAIAIIDTENRVVTIDRVDAEGRLVVVDATGAETCLTNLNGLSHRKDL